MSIRLSEADKNERHRSRVFPFRRKDTSGEIRLDPFISVSIFDGKEPAEQFLESNASNGGCGVETRGGCPRASICAVLFRFA